MKPPAEGGAWSQPPDKSKGRGRYLGGGNNKNPPMPSPVTSPLTRGPPPKLGVVNEVASESNTLTNSSSQLGSKDSTNSTLKSSEFEVDSLEQEVVLLSTNPSSPRLSRSKGAGSHLNGTVSEPRGDQGVLLPAPPNNPNLMVHYPDPHGPTPISPIWNQIGYFRAESDTSTNSEYITSYIGKLTPLPPVLSPDFKSKNPSSSPWQSSGGVTPKSGGPEEAVSDSDLAGLPSSGESEGEGQAGDGCLKWKRGRLLGKGAYGKVWEGLLSSARMIAVKEVELDTDSLERAQSVSLKAEQ